MPLEHGPSRMDTKNWSDRHNARCFASIIQTKRKCKNKVEEKNEKKNDEEPTNDKKSEEKDECSKNSEGETEDGISSNTDCHQDSEVSFMGGADEDIDTGEIEEDWIEYLKRTPETT